MNITRSEMSIHEVCISSIKIHDEDLDSVRVRIILLPQSPGTGRRGEQRDIRHGARVKLELTEPLSGSGPHMTGELFHQPSLDPHLAWASADVN